MATTPPKINPLHKRILDLSYTHGLSHLGSVLTAVDIIDELYPKHHYFILSSGHAGLALYVVLEKYKRVNAEDLLSKHGIHPSRDDFIEASAGSLGHGLGIGIGMALANPNKSVAVLITDGEVSEGSIWEALRLAQELQLDNLKIYLNFNGFAAFKETDYKTIKKQIEGFGFPVKIIKTNVGQYPFLKGQEAHYHVMTEEEYKSVS
jgi:transketolase